MCFDIFCLLMIRRPPRSTRTDTLFPYTTLCRSAGLEIQARSRVDALRQRVEPGGPDLGLGQHDAVDLLHQVAEHRADGTTRCADLLPELGLVIDRKSTRLTPVTNAHLVCRLLLEKKKMINIHNIKHILSAL